MIKQTIFFSKPASLSLKNNQLVISQEEGDQLITRPIEDIGVVIVENQIVRFTIPLMNALTDHNVAVIMCGSNAMPNSILMPLEANSIMQETVRLQIEASAPTCKRIWKEIIENKIRNQAENLHQYGKNSLLLKPLYSNVLSGDSDNREGVAAKIYWKQLFGDNFIRERYGNGPNSLLNYGYAILRAATARALIGSGLLPLLGIFHRNRYNAFPLADDIMEPYRPFVDSIVYDIFSDDPDSKLDKKTKLRLVSLLHMDVKMSGKLHPLQIALTLTTASLVKALRDNKQKIKYPTFA